MLLLFFVMGLLWENLCALEADPGDNVTLWCQHELDLAGYIYWFYQNLSTAALSTTSVPVLVGCRHFKTSGPANECYFYSGTKRMVMSVQDRNTSLTITAVNVSDTGLYYCGFLQLNQISFSNSSYLRVKGADSLFFILNLTIGLAAVILSCVLIFIIVKHRKSH